MKVIYRFDENDVIKLISEHYGIEEDKIIVIYASDQDENGKDRDFFEIEATADEK